MMPWEHIFSGEKFAKVTEMRFFEKEGTNGLGFFRRIKGIFLLRLVFANCVSFFFFCKVYMDQLIINTSLLFIVFVQNSKSNLLFLSATNFSSVNFVQPY